MSFDLFSAGPITHVVVTPYGEIHCSSFAEAKVSAKAAAKIIKKTCSIKAYTEPEPEPEPGRGCPEPGCGSDAWPYVPHGNCLYGGASMGHSASHCTADACY